MPHQCPHCHKSIEVRLTAASPSKEMPDNAKVDVGALLESIVDDSTLNDWEQKFVADLRERYEKYGDRIRMSEKQIASLRKIVAGDAGDEWK